MEREPGVAFFVIDVEAEAQLGRIVFDGVRALNGRGDVDVPGRVDVLARGPGPGEDFGNFVAAQLVAWELLFAFRHELRIDADECVTLPQVTGGRLRIADCGLRITAIASNAA